VVRALEATRVHLGIFADLVVPRPEPAVAHTPAAGETATAAP
jgi:hypothetical protein